MSWSRLRQLPGLMVDTTMADTRFPARIALQAWLSPSYPVGAYAYSHGLESAVDIGTITDKHTLRDWLEDILRYGTGRNDVILIGETVRRHAIDENSERMRALADLAELAAALNGTAELRQESLQQGAAFLHVTQRAWPHAAFDEADVLLGGNTAYPVCFGLAVAAHSCPVAPAAEGYLFAFASNLLSAAVRLNVIGQTIAQEIAATLIGIIHDSVANALDSGIEGLGSCTFLNDIASFRHEQQNARLFRS